MNTEHFEKQLRDKERELQSNLAELEGEARTSGEAEVRDSTDDATSSQGTSEAFEEGIVVSQTLEQVRDALHRLQDGSYGRCTVCGRRLNMRAWKLFLGRRTAWKISRSATKRSVKI